MLLLSALSACAGQQVRPFSAGEAVWEDDDRHHVAEMPREYWSGLAWDAIDQIVFVPTNRFLRMDFAEAAENVNAFDEVPNSSWFENRLGLREMTHEELRRGACPEAVLRGDETWTIVAGKPNGANPGFIIRDEQGRGWVIKFDGRNFRDERATAADVFGSRVYHAAGYHSPCNIIVHFDREVLQIGEDAETEDERGEDIPMAEHHIDEIVSGAIRTEDGLYRASASLFVDGRPIGPWRYQGRRRDDPNDAVRHEDRRELRGSRLLAAWLNHFDAREQNTLSTWFETEDGRNYVRHYLIDFGDCLGSRWLQDGLSRRFGYSSYFDPAHVAADFLSLGFISRPWNDVEISRVAPMLGYFDAEHFDPRRWRAGYPNPAFARETPEDGAWMARIIARMDEDAIRVMLGEGRVINEEDEAELMRVLLARRQRILDHYLRVRSPLADFEVQEDGTTVCFADLATLSGVTDASVLRYETRYYDGRFRVPVWVRTENPGGAVPPEKLCVSLVEDGHRSFGGGEGADADSYVIVDLLLYPEPAMDPLGPARLHFYDNGEAGYQLVGIERPEDAVAPGRRRGAGD